MGNRLLAYLEIQNTSCNSVYLIGMQCSNWLWLQFYLKISRVCLNNL